MSFLNRRDFIKSSSLAAISFSTFSFCHAKPIMRDHQSSSRFNLSLAQWSLHRTLNSGQLDHLDFPKKAVEAFDIHAIEYVNQFFKDKATDSMYLSEMNMRANDLGVKQLLIMIDGEGGLAELDDDKRNRAVSDHYKWVDAAKTLGCHSIRVNAYGGSDDRIAMHHAAVDGLGKLASYAQSTGINIIVENHGGLSSDGEWLSDVISEINMPNCGTLPDFGNFCIRHEKDENGKTKCAVEYDRYKGISEMMPFAKAVSAKSFDFDEYGNETTIDYTRMIEIVRKSSYSGYLGIEYEGSRLSEDDGILATKRLLEKLI
jgi:sugar phosphate isomerase/epimerase